MVRQLERRALLQRQRSAAPSDTTLATAAISTASLTVGPNGEPINYQDFAPPQPPPQFYMQQQTTTAYGVMPPQGMPPPQMHPRQDANFVPPNQPQYGGYPPGMPQQYPPQYPWQQPPGRAPPPAGAPGSAPPSRAPSEKL